MSGKAELQLVGRLREGDEAAFTTMVDRYHGALRRLARTFVSSEAAADEVVQDTWAAALDGIRGFEGRCSVKTWIFRILVNRAKTQGVREARSVPMSSLERDDDGDGDGATEPVVDSARFDDRGMWSSPPARWEADSPEGLLLRQETMAALEVAMQELPERQRQVLTLRDALGWTAEEVCNVLDVAETNQRVLLHRARSRLRIALEKHLTTR